MKKFISIMTVVLLLLSSVSLCASAVEQSLVPSVQPLDPVASVSFDPDHSVTVPQISRPDSFSANLFNTGDTPYTFYSFLDANQKAVYNTILSNPLQESYTVTLAEPISGNCSVDSDNYIVLTDAMRTAIYNAAFGGISAVGEDYPEYFWLNSYQLGFNMSGSGTQTGDSNYPWYYTITQLIVSPQLNTAKYADYATVFSLYSQLKTKVAEFPVSGHSRYEKVKSIHDNIISQVTYDPNLNTSSENPTNHEPVSVFFSPYLTVCEGYSEAFKLLCDREGIPCVVIVGYSVTSTAGHAWNYVQMDDGNWYAIDSTWDDLASSGSGFYYFLVGSDSPSSGSDTFSAKHTPTGALYNYSGFALTYPTLSTTPYSKVVGKYNSTLAVDKTNNYIYLTSGNTATASLTAAYGYNLSSTGNITGSIVKITKTGASSNILEQDTLIIRGDVVINGVADSADYEKIAECASGASQPGSDVQFAAADLNHDGAVDAFDWFILDKMMNGYSEY